MSSQSNNLDDGRQLSKVTFSSISPELMVVKIRQMSGDIKEEASPNMSTSTLQLPSPIKKSREKNRSKSGKKKNKKMDSGTPEIASESKTDVGKDSEKMDPSTSETASKAKTDVQASSTNDYTPCLRHAAENIGRKAADIPSEKINMCNNCSKSMLSYIFLVQDFLDSLAKEIRGVDPSDCLQCARQEVRNNVAALDNNNRDFSTSESTPVKHSAKKFNQGSPESKHEVSSSRHPSKSSRAKGDQRDSRRQGVYQKGPSHQSQDNNQQHPQFTYNVSPPSNAYQDVGSQNFSNSGGEKHAIPENKPDNQEYSEQQPNADIQQGTSNDNENNNRQETPNYNQNNNQQQTPNYSQNINQRGTDGHQFMHNSAHGAHRDHSASQSSAGSHPGQFESHHPEKQTFRAPAERMQPNYEVSTIPDHQQRDSNDHQGQSPSLYRDDVDGIISTLSNIERDIYDKARNTAGWEGFAENQERFVLPPSSNSVASEAFVTSCRNNAEAIGCLVVGTSLLLCRTSRTLCVLVSEGVSTAFRGALSSVFKVVQFARSLDSLGTTKLALLEQPELGITFEKLNIWRLTGFTKCVYLNPDTLVIQNCDELFDREELSAVPDIGWPDCFNSGVFVYRPSVDTFWKLMEFAEKQGSYDGGDQGLLNSYYDSWSSDINKKLSFIYNLMANVSYTYTPAFRQFGRDIKIVQFHGSFKPWHVKFFSSNGQISSSSPVHPTYVQFVHIWLSIFRISVLRLLPQNIRSYASSQETICAVEILRFFPLPSETEAEFFLTPPSVRLRLTELKLNRSTNLPILEARRRKSAEFFGYLNREEDEAASEGSSREAEAAEEKDLEGVKVSEPDVGTMGDQLKEKLEEIATEADEASREATGAMKKKAIDKNTLPGAEVGDFQGMRAWEQGRMDYKGSDSSDNVIKRLQFLMSRPNK